ncbi:MAG: hypothetical protein D6690_06515 [Nitrospirae bacterium]|nr:MAG: hypothetical protein D6690_06515 [Nitrospirota bacterium]
MLEFLLGTCAASFRPSDKQNSDREAHDRAKCPSFTKIQHSRPKIESAARKQEESERQGLDEKVKLQPGDERYANIEKFGYERSWPFTGTGRTCHGMITGG